MTTNYYENINNNLKLQLTSTPITSQVGFIILTCLINPKTIQSIFKYTNSVSTYDTTAARQCKLL